MWLSSTDSISVHSGKALLTPLSFNTDAVCISLSYYYVCIVQGKIPDVTETPGQPCKWATCLQMNYCDCGGVVPGSLFKQQWL